MYTQDRRSTKRFILQSSGCAIIDGGNVDLTTLNVSLGGALVEFATPTALKQGARLRLRLGIGFVGCATIRRIDAHDEHTLYGLLFDRFDFHSDLALSAYFVKLENHLPASPTIH